jgi:PAS domain S-box-containing protein
MGPISLSPPFQPDGRSSPEATMAYIEQAIQDGTSTFDWVHQAGDGELIPCEVRLLRLTTSTGNLVRGSLVDLRPRLAKDADIRESERKFRLLFDQSVDGLLLLDGDRFTECNQSVLDMMRCTGPEFLRLHPWDLSPPLQPDGQASDVKAREMMALAHAKGVHRFEWTHRRSDGEVFPVEVTLLPIPLGGKTVLFTSWRDISANKAAERALKASEERFRVMVRSARDIFLLINEQGELTFVSSVAQQLTGYAAEELLGSMDRMIHPEDWPAVAMAWQQLLTHPETPVRVEYRHLHKTQGFVWLEAVAQNCLQEAAIQAVAVSVRDITERKRAEQERLSLERQMLHAQKLESLGVLAGGIAHDFNNLLTAILTNLNLAQDSLDANHPVQKQLKATEGATLKASELTRQMLAYSGKGRFVVKIHDLNQVVREMTHLVQVSIAKKVKLEFSLQEGLPPVEADDVQLQQIILNLVTNASDAIGDQPGLIRISTHARQLDETYLSTVLQGQGLEPGLYCVLVVSDSGGGMTPEVQSRIFDPFFTTKAAGHGLGLSAIQGILKGHHAGMRVYSEPGQGTAFHLFFPASEAPLLATPIRAQETNRTFSGLALLVDDESSIREAAALALTRLGFEVEVAEDGLEAVALFSARPAAYRVALVDLTMPRMDGRECFHALRRLRPDLPVILCSGFSEQESMKAFLGEGLAGFIQKPYTLGMLRQAFAEALLR